MVVDEVHKENVKITMEVDVNEADLKCVKKELKEWFDGHSIGMSGFKLDAKPITKLVKF